MYILIYIYICVCALMNICGFVYTWFLESIPAICGPTALVEKSVVTWGAFAFAYTCGSYLSYLYGWFVGGVCQYMGMCETEQLCAFKQS